MIDPNDYEYLWTDHDVNYIFVSCYLFKEFRKGDFVLIHDPEKNGVSFFLSKHQHKAYSKEGVKFFSKLKIWEKEIISSIKDGKRIIKETKKDNVSLISNRELKEKILERANLFQRLGGDYFHTEFFFMDKIGRNKRIGELKFQARDVLNYFYDYNKVFRPYVKEAARRMSRKDIIWLSFQEIVSLLDGKKVPISRKNEIWILAKRNGWKPILGKKAEEIKLVFTKQFFKKKVDKIRGLSASKGIYKGKVVVIRTVFSDKMAYEIAKVQKGDVLVANTTGPEVMEACRRAGAIVTDEGGMTSHAAIISRELKIPCIVGTHKATQIFKDGDLIEVDADKGIVRKIK